MFIGFEAFIIAIRLMLSDNISYDVSGNELQELIEYRLSGKKSIFTHVISLEWYLTKLTKKGDWFQFPFLLIFQRLPDNNGQETTPSVSVKTTANGGVLLFLEEVQCG